MSDMIEVTTTLISALTGETTTITAMEPAPGAAVMLQDAWAALRAERDRRLALCDFRFNTDYPQTAAEEVAWKAYRQALRDLPDVTSDPLAPVWPEPPQG
ncbi:hypothetical protein HOY34_11345 [Xinfangfangia sp. D13-10-4-6]|uniref:tail fiber assembly protein n=1 Tax=Pseudogemmobacter hezensis TaxID=2737662 RepID=UPI0015527808|nr:tail fiber assembly protein [Pseudogemmobacter hezensis]NPD15796.1 hypothetical protein [Pseudogemmobacter hezensis]